MTEKIGASLPNALPEDGEVAAAPSGRLISLSETWFVNGVVLLSFFPFFQLIPIEKIESQPISAVLALIGCSLHGFKKDRQTLWMLALISTICVASLGSIVAWNSMPGSSISQATAYCAPVVVILFLWKRLHLVSSKLIFTSGATYIIVGLLQISGHMPNFLDSILSSLISRYQSEAVGGGRGVIMLAPEPDYASRQLILFMAFILALHRINRVSGRTMIGALIFCGSAMLLLNRSITGIGLFIILISLYGVFVLKSRYLIFSIGVFAFLIFYMFDVVKNTDLSNVTSDSPRIVQLGATVFQEATKGTFGFKDVVQFASARVVTNVAAIRALDSHLWFGVGIGQAEVKILSALQNDELFRDVGFDTRLYGNLKPQAYFACFILETGLFGLLIIGLFIIVILSGSGAPPYNRADKALVISLYITGLLQLMALGPHSLPEPWLLLILPTMLSKSEHYLMSQIHKDQPADDYAFS
jgi:hypothetical protein